MSEANDFVIGNYGHLKKYVGTGEVVTVPDGVTVVSESAFEGCRNIREVVLPESVNYISSCAFTNCENLTTVIIPDTVTTIGVSAFEGCVNLTDLKLPDKLTSLGNNAFDGCPCLSNLVDDSGFIINDGILLQYAGPGGDVVLPNGIESIGFRVFAGNDDIHSVVIPEGVTIITESAFMNCSNLKRVIIPEGVTAIQSTAFTGCAALDDIKLPETLRLLGRAFDGCTSLKQIVIPNSVECFGTKVDGYPLLPDTFSCDCDVLISARSRDISVFRFTNQCRLYIDMGEWKSEYTKALKDWNIVSLIADDVMSVPAVHRNAAVFGFVHNADKYYDSETTKQYESYMKKNAAKLCPFAFDHPEVLHYLCNHQLIKPKDVDLYTAEAVKREDTELKALLLDYQNALGQDSITKARAKKEKEKQDYEDATAERLMAQDLSKGISGITFAVTGKLKSWPSKDKLKEYLEQYGAMLSSSITKKTDYLVTNDTDSGSEKNKKAKELGLTILSEEEFNEMIGARFRDAEHITIPSWLKEIRNSAFYRCTSLKEAVIPDGVRSIGMSAFALCTNLEKIVIPESVQTIGRGAFYACHGLKDQNNFIIGRDVLYQYSGYECEEPVVKVPDGIVVIDDSAFKENNHIVEVIIPNGVKRIGDETFRGCKNLKRIVIPDSISEIGWSAFSGCGNLTEIVLSHSLQKIGFSTFSYCESLESLIIPESVIEIEDSVFDGCTNLKEVYIPASVKKIGDDRVFTGCRKLVIHTPAASYAEQYAKAHKIKVATE